MLIDTRRVDLERFGKLFLSLGGETQRGAFYSFDELGLESKDHLVTKYTLPSVKSILIVKAS